ncbi:MAG: zinc ribbon domain-containing protein [Eubacteriales bacterium]|nr:zinc ribbon domain-containing protein [Eubacteriales bacterium]
MEKICQSCGMPMPDANVLGINADGTINEDYCKYCYKDGKFIDDVTMEEYINMCSQFGAQANMTNEQMKEFCQKLFPTLKRWKKQ